jgi:hypothetical protein
MIKRDKALLKSACLFFLFPIELLLDCKNNMNYIQVSIKQGPLKSGSKLCAPETQERQNSVQAKQRRNARMK